MGNKRGRFSMHIIKFAYVEKQSKILGKTFRPVIPLEVFSEIKNNWEIIDNVLADTGADISILPRFLAEPLVDDITKGQYVEIKGVVPNTVLIAFIHILKLKLNNIEFETKVALADSNDVPPILGRYKALDLFDVSFNGKEVRFTYLHPPA